MTGEIVPQAFSMEGPTIPGVLHHVDPVCLTTFAGSLVEEVSQVDVRVGYCPSHSFSTKKTISLTKE